MSDEYERNVTPAVRDLIHSNGLSMDHVEILLQLQAHPNQTMKAQEIAAGARVSPRLAESCAEDLVTSALIARGPSPMSYRFEDSNPQARAIGELRQMYDERPVSLVRTVYDRPTTPLQSFADAFRLRKTDE